MADLLALQAEYDSGSKRFQKACATESLHDRKPARQKACTTESLRDSATAEALEAITDLDLDARAHIEPPRGYGRD